MTINEFIKDIKKRKDLREVVHHEEIPPRSALFAETARPLHQALKKSLSSIGIDKLFSHQAQAIDLVGDGRNVVVMTPTSSGKSLIYNIPVIESLLADNDAHALYLFPLKGLEQDQLGAFRELTERLFPGRDTGTPKKRTAFVPSLSEIYDGDTTAYRRKKIRETPPAVILTNPDMLHMAINAFHPKWERFFRNLKFVVVDEIHTYKGVFGSHVANVIRRFRRIAKMYGADPVFIACSATIANPKGLAETLMGLRFELVDESGAPAGTRHFLFINPLPETSPYTIATRVFTSSVRAGLKTIAFTKARKVTELMHTWVNETAPDIGTKISSYRAGFLPEERRDIETRLFNGELTGVISTSALELGVDIGGLDVCVLAGYPGSISSTWQRGGRAGRSGRDSLIVMVALQDALDQYFMRNPDDFFKRNVEAAVLDFENPSILKGHLLSAVAEGYLKPTDSVYDAKKYVPVLNELEREGKARHWQKGDIWYPRKRTPQLDISIREAGEPYTIVKEDGRTLGESSSARVLYELHPGAIYLHRGVQYKVVKLDISERKVFCRLAPEPDYYTRAISSEETEIVSEDAARDLRGVSLHLGRLKVTERVLGYRKKQIYTDKTLGEFPLELPETVFTTTGVWLQVDESLIGAIRENGYGSSGGLHAAEHAMIAALPLYALCDRMDLGGVSYPMNPELQSAAIFVYDGHEGGVGLTKRGFECASEWFSSTLRLMEECACEIACPSCTQDPKCGNNNEPLDKRGAITMIRKWLGG